MKRLITLAAGVACLAMAPAANAAVEIQQSPSFVQPEENVLLDTDAVPGDNTLTGTTNQTDSSVLFQSSTDNIVSGPQGQAEVAATGAGAANGLGQLTFSLANGGTFTSAEFNILASVGGMITLDALDAANQLIHTFTIGSNGQNYFGLLADSSTPISAISIMALGNTNISSIGQFRLGGIADSPIPSAVPEPGTWLLMIAGFGLAGAGLRRRTAKGERRVSFA